jgi:CBS domain-containing protein
MNGHNHRPATVRDAMRASFVSVEEAATTRRILAGMDEAGVDELPIVGDDGAFRAMVERRAVQRHLYDRGEENATAAMMAEEAIASAKPGEPVDDAIARMLAADLTVLPVVSGQGRLEGLLVLDDVKRVPDLVEAVDEGRREHAEVAEAGVTRLLTVCSLGSAALGMVLLALWIEGPAYGLPVWVSWVDAIAALLAFVGAVAVSSGEMFSVPLWVVAGIGLCFAAAVGHSWHDGIGSTWVQLALALPFFAMTLAIGAALPRRRRLRIGHRTADVTTGS